MGRYSDILLVSDFDRTITDTKNEIPAANLEAINRFMAEGGAFTVATGHSVPSHRTRYSRVPMNAPCIVSNGSVVYDYEKSEAVAVTPLPQGAEDVIRAVIAQYPQVSVGLETLDGQFSVTGEIDLMRKKFMEMVGLEIRSAPMEQVPHPWIKLCLSIDRFGEDIATFDPFKNAKPEDIALLNVIQADFIARYGDKFAAVRSMPTMIEIQAASTSKGAAARALARELGRKTLVCVGDAPNDISMLREADIGFVTGDGDKSLMTMGFHVAAPCTQGSVASVINAL